MTKVSLSLPVLVPCAHWSSIERTAVYGRCARGEMHGMPIVGYCVHACSQAQWTDGGAWHRAYLAETRPQASAARPAALGSAPCPSCGEARTHVWLGVRWIGRPWPLRRWRLQSPLTWEESQAGTCRSRVITLRARWRWPLRTEPDPGGGCGCIERLKTWMDQRRAARTRAQEAAHGT